MGGQFHVDIQQVQVRGGKGVASRGSEDKFIKRFRRTPAHSIIPIPESFSSAIGHFRPSIRTGNRISQIALRVHI